MSLKLKTIFTLLLLSQTLLFSSTFEWKSQNEVTSVDKPLDEIFRVIEENVKRVIVTKKPIDLTNAIPPEIPKPILPPEVEKPGLPVAIQLQRGEFEKKTAFEKRVQEASAKRDNELKVLQEVYRLKVEIRNKKVEELSAQYNKKIEKRNLIIERLQQIQENNAKNIKKDFEAQYEVAYNQIAEFANIAIDKVYGKAKVIYKGYDPDGEVMYLTITSSDGENFKKDIEINIPPQRAKSLKSDISLISPEIIFDVKTDEQKAINFQIDKISLAHNSKIYLAQDITTEFVFKPVQITIDNSGASFNAKNKNLIVKTASAEFELQNPNLSDKFMLGAVAYTDSGAIIGANALVNKIKTLPEAQIDKNKWLFMVAIEDYDETDKVIFAKRSAIAMKEAMQTRFGIDDRHTYDLINEKATSGAIKDKLRSMLANVENNDTIYFYYSGHGIPGADGDAYILPKDKVVDFIDKEPFFKLGNIYDMLSRSKAKHSFAFIDACFSGRTDNVLVFKGVAPGLIKIKKTIYDESKMTIITAGLNKEFSNAYKQEKYRLFSYYLTSALIDGVKDVSLLHKKVNYNVLEKSKEIGDRYKQSPQIYGNQNMRLY